MEALAAINLALALLAKSQELSALFNKARAEGRSLSKAEWDGIIAADDAALKDLDAAIAQAKAENR